MKTCILGLMLLGFTNLTFSQNNVAFNDVKPNLQSTHSKANIKAVVSNNISKRITGFQNVVSNYDIRSKSIYTPNEPSTYTVVFKEAKNIITNVYNHEGEVISSEQKFEAIRLPDHIGLNILKEHPNWAIEAVNCTIKYEKGKNTLVTYKVKISNGTKTKTIKVTD